MKLYHCNNARSLRPLWCLEEMGLDYELINMEFPPRTTYPGYLDLNNLGTVPTFIDGEITMTATAMLLSTLITYFSSLYNYLTYTYICSK